MTKALSKQAEQRVGRRARRRGMRGAVMIEAVLVSGVIITVLISGIAIFGVYRAKITVMNNARTSTWTPALAGCGSSPQLNSMAAVAELPTGGGQPPMPAEAVGSWLTLNDQAQERSLTVPVFGRGQAVNADHRVVCNESSGGGGDAGSLFGRFSDLLMRE